METSPALIALIVVISFGLIFVVVAPSPI